MTLIAKGHLYWQVFLRLDRVVLNSPQTMTELTTPVDIESMNKLIDYLEEDDDVQNVYHNWDEKSSTEFTLI